MDIGRTTETVEALADILKAKGLQAVSVQSDDFSITIEAPEPAHCHAPALPPQNFAQFAPQFPQGGAPAVAEAPAPVLSGNIVKSPIVGTFYDKPSPDKPPFAKVGDSVTKGDVIFIVESMKIMNEIVSEFTGKVAEIFVTSGSAVEFDQNIMRIE